MIVALWVGRGSGWGAELAGAESVRPSCAVDEQVQSHAGEFFDVTVEFAGERHHQASTMATWAPAKARAITGTTVERQ